MSSATLRLPVALLFVLLVLAGIVAPVPSPGLAAQGCGPDRTTGGGAPVLDERWRLTDPEIGGFQLLGLDDEQAVVLTTVPGCALSVADIRAIDLESGAQRWAVEPEDLPTPFIGETYAFDGAVVVTGSDYDAGTGWVALIDPGSGDIAWDRELDDVVRFTWAGLADRTLVMTADHDDGSSRLVGFDLETGDELWTTRITGTPERTVLDTDADVVCVLLREPGALADDLLADVGLIAIDMEDGAIRWTRSEPRWLTGDDRSFGRQLWSTPAGFLYGERPGSVADLTLLDAATGEARWAAQGIMPVTVDGTESVSLLTGNASPDTSTVALGDVASGDTIWQTGIDAVASTAYLSESTVIVSVLASGSDDPATEGGVVALDRRSGEILWETATAGLTSGTPSQVTDDGISMVVGADATGEDEDARIVVLDPGTGETLLDAGLPDLLGARLLGATDGTVLVQGFTDDGATLIAFEF